MTAVDQDSEWNASTLFSLLGEDARTYLEIGRSDSSANVVSPLRAAGWRGWSFDAHAVADDVTKAFVTRESLKDLLDETGVPSSVDLLSMAAGFNDFHILDEFLRHRRARVVVVRLNQSLGGTADAVVPYLPLASRQGESPWFGASFRAFASLGAAHGYVAVHHDSQHASLYLVAKDDWPYAAPDLADVYIAQFGDVPPCDDPSLVFLTSEHYLVQGVATVDTRWGRVSYFLQDEYIGPAFTRGGYWEADTIRTVVRELETHQGVVLDIGAHVGTHTLGIAAQRPDLRFLCFEPQHGLRLLLERNIAENGLSDRVQVLPWALVDAPRQVRLSATFSDGEGAGKQIEYDGSVVGNFGGVQIGDDGADVDAVSVDSLLSGPLLDSSVVYIKIDVEGAERLVFSGAQQTIESNRPIIMFEDRDDRRLPSHVLDDLGVPESARGFDVLGYLADLGYELRPLGLDYLAMPR